MSEVRGAIPARLVHGKSDELTICQCAVVRLRIEINLDHLAPPPWHKDPVQLFCVVRPPACVDSAGYAPTVDNVEVRGIEVESGMCVRSNSSCSTRALGVTFGSGRQPRDIDSGGGREGSFEMRYLLQSLHIVGVSRRPRSPTLLSQSRSRESAAG